MPDLAARLNQPAHTLSGGHQQLLALARAVLTQPRLLLLDEPFEGLAHPTAARVQALIRRFTETGGAVIIADHTQTMTGSRTTLRDGTLHPSS